MTIVYIVLIVLFGIVCFWKLEEIFSFLLRIKKRIISIVFADKKEKLGDDICGKCFDKDDSWYNSDPLISHACGGHIGLIYSNSLEALNKSIEEKFRVIEVDLRLSSDGQILCTHGFEDGIDQLSYDVYMNELVDCRFHPMDISMLLSICSSLDIFIIADIKRDDEFDVIISALEKLIPDKERFFVQIGKEQLYSHTLDFPVLYNLGRTNDYKRSAGFCLKHNIKVVSISFSEIKATKEWQVLLDHGIAIYVHTVNRIKEYIWLKNLGVSGVFTDFLTPSDLKGVSK